MSAEKNISAVIDRHYSPPTLAVIANVFNSGVRESGSLPNKFPSAKAGVRAELAVPESFGCTPIIRASSVSKWDMARRLGSLSLR